MASPILTTPQEIWRMICASLSPSDLWGICLTRRVLRFLAEPFLYAHIEWTWTMSENPPITQFLRSIVHRPELASFVHTTILNGDTFDPDLKGSHHESPELPGTEVVLEELVECIIPYAEEWIQEFTAGTMDGFLTLLLSQLPDLRFLYVGKNFTRESRLMGMIPAQD